MVARNTRARRGARNGRPANVARGEHQLTLAGVTYLLRPSHQALEAIETEMDTSLIDLSRQTNACKLKQADLAFIVAELIRAGADPDDKFTGHVSAERIGELLHEQGRVGAYAVITLVLMDAISGGRTVEGKAKAVATPTTPRPATAE